MIEIHSSPVDMVRLRSAEWKLESTDLFRVEISIFVTVGYGDREEVIVCASIRCQSVQRSLELGTTRGL